MVKYISFDTSSILFQPMYIADGNNVGNNIEELKSDIDSNISKFNEIKEWLMNVEHSSANNSLRLVNYTGDGSAQSIQEYMDKCDREEVEQQNKLMADLAKVREKLHELEGKVREVEPDYKLPRK